MQKYKSKLEVKAIQFTNSPENIAEIKEWIGELAYVDDDDVDYPKLVIDDYTEASLNEWITSEDEDIYIVYSDEYFNDHFELIKDETTN
jgi:hypothetical protein